MTTATGTWALTMSTPMGEQTATLTVIDMANATLTSPEGSTEPVNEFKANGDRLTWKVPVKKPIPLTLHFDVTVTGDLLEGKFRPGMFPPSPVTGKRA
ncbi:hypothetical protein [Novosphingobium sp.]|uniref:hypothetical protein n=1 Tax=Novosphingobium sp. TaxID=1874826 RepID=UPI00261026CA|nr:hypothetical protein [Novosphingobium sp.]